MNSYHIALGIAAALAAVVAWRQPRALLYIGALALSFVASVWWLYQGLPAHPAIAATCDALVCILIYIVARQRWETHLLYPLMLLSVLVNVVATTGHFFETFPTPSQNVYGGILEAINYLALMLIASIPTMRHIRNRYGTGASARGFVGSISRASLALEQASVPSSALRD